MNRVFIGWDKHEALAYDVCRMSLGEHSRDALMIRSLNLRGLTSAGLMYREPDSLASTEFTYSRFLVPHLCAFEGWALFMDCDILCRRDIGELFALAQPDKAVMVVKHNYTPTAGTKMGRAIQSAYPRKNWSSVVLWNCGHKSNKAVTVKAVNTMPAAWLHRFQWLADSEIGELEVDWNYLVGHNTSKECPDPALVHFTTGIPGIHKGHEKDEYADDWLRTAEAAQRYRTERDVFKETG